MLRNAFLILSTIAVGGVITGCQATKSKNISVGGDNEEVADKTMHNYLATLSKYQNVHVKVVKALLSSILHRDDGTTIKDNLEIKDYDKILVVLYQTLPTQKPLKVNTQGVKIEERKGRTYIHIPTKNLKDGEHILVQDRDGGVLIDYTIVVK
ncbi:MAG: hypothetical protein U9N49_01700 [Campylobacterota bacterium]|nr:hypothetical protein [Campylobacterota bacterium]